MLAKNIIRSSYTASRAVPVVLADGATGAPASLDETTRSVEVIASTEQPVMVFDWERWEPVMEVLLMSGCKIPSSRQVVLLDSHNNSEVKNVFGSFRAMEIKETQHGPSLVGRAHYSTAIEAEGAYVKVKEGHITDVSIGYAVGAHVWIEAGESVVIEGKSYAGPLRVAIEWEPKELSVCPIGADDQAKFRQAKPQPENKRATKKEKTYMNRFLARLRQLMGTATRAELELLNDAGENVNIDELTPEELAQVVEEAQSILDDAEGLQGAADGGEGETPAADGEGQRSVPSTPAPPAHGRTLNQRQVQQVERARVMAIQALCRAHDVPAEVEAKMLNSGTSLRDAKAQVLDLRSNSAPTGPGFHVSTGRTEQEKVRSAMGDALLMRCGVNVEQAAPGAQELRSYSLREMARECLVRSGGRVNGSPMELVGRALSTTDLPHLLVDTSRRVLMDAYQQAPQTWRTWCQVGSASDFKKSTSVGLEGDVKPKLMAEGSEYQEGRMAETAEEYHVEQYGRKMKITRQAIINDDLNALAMLPRMYGEAAAAAVGDVAYAALLNAPNMGDGKPLFDASHGNLHSGGGAPTVENLGKLVTAMKLQKDGLGNRLHIMPKFFLAPVALETACEQFFMTNLQANTPIVSTQAKPIAHNPYGGNFFTRVYDSRIDDLAENSYFIAAAMPTIMVFFLGGVETPYIEDHINFDSDAVESKVRLDVGAKALSWRGLQASEG